MSGDCGCGGRASGHCACGCAPSSLAPPASGAGLSTIGARLGDYRDFFGDATRRLSDRTYPALSALGTRDPSDPAIGWLDAWAVAADVLTFYRARLTNEGYLRTAVDELALRELAALVGHKPRPGVAATAHFAYLMEPAAAATLIEPRAKAQTVPRPGEQMQTFETDETFYAHAGWSKMAPRSGRPARIELIDALLRPTLRLAGTTMLVRPGERVLFVFGPKLAFQVVREVSSAKLDVFGGVIELTLAPRVQLGPEEVARPLLQPLVTLRDKIAAVPASRATTPLAVRLLEGLGSFFLGGSAADARRELPGTTETTLEPLQTLAADLRTALDDIVEGLPPIDLVERPTPSSLDNIAAALAVQPAAQLASGRQLSRSAIAGLSTPHGQDRLALLSAAIPGLADAMAPALDAMQASPQLTEFAPQVFLFRTTAHAFGALAPPSFEVPSRPVEHTLDDGDKSHAFLDMAYEGIRPDSYVVVDLPQELRQTGVSSKIAGPNRSLRIGRVSSVQTVARRVYDSSGKSTRLTLVALDAPSDPMPLYAIRSGPTEMGGLRNALYHVQSEPVAVADDVTEGEVGQRSIELQVRVDGLQPGQLLIVSGERTDIKDANGRAVPGVRGAELAMIESVTQAPGEQAPGDTNHTRLTLVQPLAFTYKLSTTWVYGNVVAASHGEKVSEILGSGDASRSGQRFVTKRPALTFTSAATPSGVVSSAVVRVNGQRYEQVESLLDAGPTTRAYELAVDAAGLATLTFGDGVHGARLPTGAQNVRMEYRVGLGTPGNAKAHQISLLTTRPLGVTGVVNPLRAAGGADRDTAERIRRDAPLATRALSRLSRLVSVSDYASFARRFAGIGHADAVRLSDGAQQVVYVTVAGLDDVPLHPDGELLANLRAAYERFGDPSYPVEIGVRELKVLVIEARVAIHAGANWDDVEPAVRRRLLDTFSFERRRLAQPAYLSEVVAAAQRTAGVAWIDVDRFGGISERDAGSAEALATAVDKIQAEPVVFAARAANKPPAEMLPGDSRFLPAQLVFVLPDAAGLVTLNPA
jgi:hypothetical protein